MRPARDLRNAGDPVAGVSVVRPLGGSQACRPRQSERSVSAITPSLLGRADDEVAVGSRWWGLAGATFLGLALVVFAIVIHFAAGPAAVAIGAPAPHPQVAADANTSVRATVTNPRSQQHLVLLSDNPVLVNLLRARIAADDLVKIDAGALAAPLTFEVILVPPNDNLATLAAGLTEYQAQCVSSSCPAMSVLDLRSKPTAR